MNIASKCYFIFKLGKDVSFLFRFNLKTVKLWGRYFQTDSVCFLLSVQI